MAIEKYANVVVATTLSAAYTAASGSISVASAAGFPAAGTFRVRLGNAAKTVFRVDSIAGTTFSGAAEANDGNADSGATVTGVVSRGSLERLLQSPEANRIFAPTGVSGGDRVGPLQTVIHPITADYAWVNQGTTALDDQFGYTRLDLPSASTSLRIRKKAAPGTPYTVDLMMQYRDASASKYGGLVFRESGTGKLHVLQFISTNNNCQVVNFTNETTFSSAPAATTLEGSVLGSLAPVWLRVKDDGTNLKFSASRDGKYYFTEMSLGRTSFMAGGPDEVGFFGNVDGAAGVFALDIFHIRFS